MAVPLRHLTLLLAVLLALANRPFAPGAPAGERQLEFSVFCPDSEPHLCYVPRPGADRVPLVFFPTARSPDYVFGGPSPVCILDARSGEMVATVDVPLRVRKALFILVGEEHAGRGLPGFHVAVVDDSAPEAGLGTLRILNLSGLPLTGTINRAQISLRDGLNEPVRVNDSATINLRTPFNGRTYQAYAETVTLGPANRALLLLLPPRRRGSLEVQSRVLVEAGAPPPPAGSP